MKRPEVVQLRFIQPREHVEYGKIMVILPQDIGTDDDEEGEDVPPEPVPHQRLSHGSEGEQGGQSSDEEQCIVFGKEAECHRTCEVPQIPPVGLFDIPHELVET